MTSGHDTVLRLFERDTGTTRFIYKTRDWRQTREALNQMSADGQPEAIEELYSGTDANCDAFVEAQKLKYRLTTPRVKFAADPSAPRQFENRVGRLLANTQTGEKYPSMSEAARALGVSYGQVWRFVHGVDRRFSLPLRAM